MENLKVTLPEVMYSECFSRDTESFSAQRVRVRVRVIFFVWKPTKLLARIDSNKKQCIWLNPNKCAILSALHIIEMNSQH